MKSIKGAKCFLISCHGGYEWDISRMFQSFDIQIPIGLYDVGGTSRPKVKGVTDYSLQEPTRSRIEHQECEYSDFADVDFCYTMNVELFNKAALNYSRFKPTILNMFGQNNPNSLQQLALTLNENSKLWIVCYSVKEYQFLYERATNSGKDRLWHIRFAKERDIYRDDSVTRANHLYIACNSIHKRGDSCGWPYLYHIIGDMDYRLSGNHTEEIGQLGCIPFEQMIKEYQTCGAYLSTGTVPAPYVLNVIEAMMSGAPTASYDNGFGITQEGLFPPGVGCVSKDILELHLYLKRCLKDKSYAAEQSEKIKQVADSLVGWDVIRAKWAAFFSNFSRVL